MEIKKFLDEYVIVQDDAKKILAVAVYNHYKRLNQKFENDVEIEKSNIIIPTIDKEVAELPPCIWVVLKVPVAP